MRLLILMMSTLYGLPAFAGEACVGQLISSSIEKSHLDWISKMLAMNIEVLDRFDSVTELDGSKVRLTEPCLESRECLEIISKENQSCALYVGKVNQIGQRLGFELTYTDSNHNLRHTSFELENRRSIIVDALESHLKATLPPKQKRRPVVSTSSLAKAKPISDIENAVDLITWKESPGDPDQIAAWSNPPSVVVCMRSLFTESRIKEAISYWEKLGYAFQSVTYDSLQSECNEGDFIPGVILITDNITPDHHYFLARTFMNISHHRLSSARIEMKPEARQKDYLLEHELGHALGWTHATRGGHLMCEDYSQMTRGSAPVVKRESHDHKKHDSPDESHESTNPSNL